LVGVMQKKVEVVAAIQQPMKGAMGK